MFEHATLTRASISLAGAGLLVALAACSSESQTSARDRATTAVCNKLQSCGQLDAGQIYTSRDDCQVQQTAYWQNTWPPESCEGRIDSTNLDRCLTAIDQSQCGNGLDFLDIVLNKCTRDSVCDGM
jgi:Family of unknown function (DUF6184)